MLRLLEKILNLKEGFLSKGAELSIQFNPHWPFQDRIGALPWNFILGMLAIMLVVWIYRREGRRRGARIFLGSLRLLLLAFVIAMLNGPTLARTENTTEPSVLAFLMDDSMSMQVKDGATGPDGQPISRFQAVLNLLSDNDQALLKELSKKHIIRFYRFDNEADAVGQLMDVQPDSLAGVAKAIKTVKADGDTTRIFASLRTTLQKLQGEHVAGVILLTDGRDNPEESRTDNKDAIRKYGVRVFPIAVGSDKPPKNVSIENLICESDAFVRDMVSTRVRVRASGYPAGHKITVALKDKNTGQPLLRVDGKPAQEIITIGSSATTQPSGEEAKTGEVFDVEINFRPMKEGKLDFIAEATKEPDEVDQDDNVYPAQIDVLDTKISVLYCEGYPRWDYRYLKDELIRDKSVDVSCLLFSADVGFAQEGNKPITRFPENMKEMLDYDVVLFGDVDSRQFTDAQLQLVADFVLKKHGGFGMVAGPKYAPYSFRSTPIEEILPVSIRQASPEETINAPAGWRPILTKAGQDSSIFRFFEDRKQNEQYLTTDLQPLFWYCHGITVKRDIGEVYAEHPADNGPDGRKAPILVLGRYGGRTLFSAIDDSWRWRFYTGESIFDTYWIQQLRYLAREKKLGQRRFTLAADRPAYERGEQIQVRLNVLDPDLLRQLPDAPVLKLMREGSDGEKPQPEPDQVLERQAGQKDVYTASWRADKSGRFTLSVPALSDKPLGTVLVKVPRQELTNAQVDTGLLNELLPPVRQGDQPKADVPKVLRLYAGSDSQEVRSALLSIPSAAVPRPVIEDRRLWDAPLAIILFVSLITTEWVLRKVFGML